MERNGLAPHESMQIHELLTFKNICLTKSFAMSPFVSDDELKDILQQDVTTSEKHIEELRDLLQQSILIGNKK